jgi:Caspase domain
MRRSTLADARQAGDTGAGIDLFPVVARTVNQRPPGADQRAELDAGEIAMVRHVLCAALLAFGLLATSGVARAESRLALVIGQSAYRAVVALPNPVNDARAVTQLLTDSGFEVTSVADLSQKDMNRQISEFAAKIAAKGPDTVALLFYAGHGLQVDGENYLLPVDIDVQREADIPLQAVRLNDLLNTLNSVPSRMRILLLDACRNNPFPAISGTIGRGLAMLDAKSGAPGTFLSYSTSPGAGAEDGNGTNSPYTTALLAAAREPELTIEAAFKRVRLAVNKATSGRQTPWDSSSLTEDFRFIGASDTSVASANTAVASTDTSVASINPGVANANAGPTPVVVKRSVAEWTRQLQGMRVEPAHDIIVNDGSLEAYQAFVALYAEPPYGAEARTWLALHLRMAAWNEAVLINTVASYQAFLAVYPDSDLTPTARKLIDRLRYRPVIASAVAMPIALPTNVALGPTCPCTPAPLPIKKVDVPKKSEAPKKSEDKPAKKHDDDPPKRANRPPRVRDTDDDVVVYDPPPRDYSGPPVRLPPIGLGIGIGGYGGGLGGGMGGGFGGGGYGRGQVGGYSGRRGY